MGNEPGPNVDRCGLVDEEASTGIRVTAFHTRTHDGADSTCRLSASDTRATNADERRSVGRTLAAETEPQVKHMDRQGPNTERTETEPRGRVTRWANRAATDGVEVPL
jgi:hypothetical protein